MTHSLPVRLLRLSLVGAATLLAGCCANNVCDCTPRQDAIRLRFSADTLGAAGPGFRAADLDTLLLTRSLLPYNPAGPSETVALFRRGLQRPDSALVLDHATPFARASTGRLDRYRYVVQYLAHPVGGPAKGVPTTVLTLDKVVLKGSLEGNGCCTCYANTQKDVYRDSLDTAVSLEQKNDAVLITKP